MICNTILDAMGHTPLVRLNRMTTPDMAEVLVKFEALNVGGSIKTRTAYNMIRDAEARGVLSPDSVIVEPTSGNQGIGLALVGAVRGYKTVIVMPDSVSEERHKLVRHYGAQVILVHDAGNIGAPARHGARDHGAGGEADPRLLLGRGHGRHAERHRRGAEGSEPWHRDLGRGAAERRHPCGRHRWHPPADGHRRRADPRQPQHADLLAHLRRHRRRGPRLRARPRRQGRPSRRHLRRHERVCGAQAREAPRSWHEPESDT